MHSQRVLHQDIKAENIFCDGRGAVKIGDLGLGRLLSSTRAMRAPASARLSTSLEMCEEHRRRQSDIWALGCLAYELCALRPPFIAANQLALARRSSAPHRALPPPTTRWARFLVTKLLEKDVRRRPTAEQVLRYRRCARAAPLCARRSRSCAGRTTRPMGASPLQLACTMARAMARAAGSRPSPLRSRRRPHPRPTWPRAAASATARPSLSPSRHSRRRPPSHRRPTHRQRRRRNPPPRRRRRRQPTGSRHHSISINGMRRRSKPRRRRQRPGRMPRYAAAAQGHSMHHRRPLWRRTRRRSGSSRQRQRRRRRSSCGNTHLPSSPRARRRGRQHLGRLGCRTSRRPWRRCRHPLRHR